jgi:hypothetical protein
MATEFTNALVALVGRELAERFSKKFEPLHEEVCLGVLGYEALAMFVYTTPLEWHERINRELWNNRPSNEVLVFAAALNSGLAKAPPRKGLVYRGYAPPNLDKFLRDYHVGQRKRMPAFTSAAIDPAKAFNGNVFFTIRSHTAGILWMWSADYGETDEVVFPTGTIFDVLSVERRGDRAFIALEEVSRDHT